MRLFTVAPFVFVASSLLACRDSPPPSPSQAQNAVAAGPSQASETPPPGESPPAHAEHMVVKKIVLTSGVENKEPKDVLESVKAGEKVWAHLTVRNRTGETRNVRLVFRVEGQERSSISLEIKESWQFRTWGYNTAQKGDVGKDLTLQVYETDGTEIGSAKIKVVQ